jgi:hypothetical protein
MKFNKEKVYACAVCGVPHFQEYMIGLKSNFVCRPCYHKIIERKLFVKIQEVGIKAIQLKIH